MADLRKHFKGQFKSAAAIQLEIDVHAGRKILSQGIFFFQKNSVSPKFSSTFSKYRIKPENEIWNIEHILLVTVF